MSTVAKSLTNIKKIKQRRRRVALLIILLIIGLTIYFIIRPKNYEKKYQQNDFEITEKYDKKLAYYSFEIKKDSLIWHFVSKDKYSNKRKLINEVAFIEQEGISCIIPKSEKLLTYPQCIENNSQIDYHLVPDILKDQIESSYYKKINASKDTYEKININHIDNQTFFIWNYKGFYMINNQEKKTIPIFEKDIYDLKLVSKVEDLLVIPNYNEQYYFNKFYLINTKSGKLTNWDFKDSLYMDGYFLGTQGSSLFFVDKKNKIEWEIAPSKKKMRKVGTSTKDGKIYQDGWEKISLTKLVNDTYSFHQKEVYHYEISDGLYVRYLECNSKKKISEKNVKEIVAVIENKVYYLVADSLYSYSEENGEVLLMSYFEWNFNYKNMIFIA